MKFDLDKSLEILERTPLVISAMLSDLSDSWSLEKESGEGWSAYDILGHLIHGEKTDWIPRMEIILSDNADKRFEPFDQAGHFKETEKKSLRLRLDEFQKLRAQNLAKLRSRKIDAAALRKKGIHPEFGEVTLQQHLATWVVHDLNHISQIMKVIAARYASEVGPWKQYLSILQSS